jgi:hypothetical protein
VNREEAKQLLPIIQAFAEGKAVQYKCANIWNDVTGSPCFACDPSCYRIKPEPRVREWKPEEMPRGPFLVVAADCDPLDRWERMYACRAVNNADKYPNSPWVFQVAAPNQQSRTSYAPSVMARQFVMIHLDGSTSPCGVLEATP